MAKKGKEKPIYLFQRVGNALHPVMEYDLGGLDSIRQGERVTISIRQVRHGARHRAYWAMLSEVKKACGIEYSVEKLHEIAKLANGVVDVALLPSGKTIVTPGSIAFDQMGEPEFHDFFQSVEMWLANVYGWVPPKRERD